MDAPTGVADGDPLRAIDRFAEAARGRIVATADAQVGWSAPNRKALEPADIAPTWVRRPIRV